jgi:signal transduction histidine kinase
MIFRSRDRPTLGLTVLVVLCPAVFALYLYAATLATPDDDLARLMQVRAQQVAGRFDFMEPEEDNAGIARSLDSGLVGRVASTGLLVEVFDAQGRVLACSDNAGLSCRLGEMYALPLPLATPLVFAKPPRPGAFLAYGLPAVRQGQAEGLIIVAAPRHGVPARTQPLLALLAGSGLGLLLLILGAGALMWWRLRPLDATFAAERQFMADASHSLRTPLATLRGRSEVLLLSTALDPDTRAGLVTIRDEAAWMGRMVANLLVLARGDEGQTIARDPVELDLLLLDIVQQAHTLADGVEVRIGHEDQAVVLGDADLLKQAMLNLIENALAHTPSGGQIELSLTVRDDEACMAVRDTGTGIAPNDLTRIFDQFYRVDQSRSRYKGGAGLGLSIVRWVVEAHGGHVTVESALGAGSTFTVALPLSNHSLTTPLPGHNPGVRC